MNPEREPILFTDEATNEQRFAVFDFIGESSRLHRAGVDVLQTIVDIDAVPRDEAGEPVLVLDRLHDTEIDSFIGSWNRVLETKAHRVVRFSQAMESEIADDPALARLVRERQEFSSSLLHSRSVDLAGGGPSDAYTRVVELTSGQMQDKISRRKLALAGNIGAIAHVSTVAVESVS